MKSIKRVVAILNETAQASKLAGKALKFMTTGSKGQILAKGAVASTIISGLAAKTAKSMNICMQTCDPNVVIKSVVMGPLPFTPIWVGAYYKLTKSYGRSLCLLNCKKESERWKIAQYKKYIGKVRGIEKKIENSKKEIQNLNNKKEKIIKEINIKVEKLRKKGKAAKAGKFQKTIDKYK